MGIQTGTLQQWLRLEADSLLTSALEALLYLSRSLRGWCYCSPFIGPIGGQRSRLMTACTIGSERSFGPSAM